MFNKEYYHMRPSAFGALRENPSPSRRRTPKAGRLRQYILSLQEISGNYCYSAVYRDILRARLLIITSKAFDSAVTCKRFF